MTPREQTAICKVLLDVFDAGVLVCDRDGQILMHNMQALTLLGIAPTDASAEVSNGEPNDGSVTPVRDRTKPLKETSIFAFIDRRLLMDAFDKVKREVEAGAAPSRVVFVAALSPERLLRVKVVHIPGTATPNRFVLHLRPMEQWSDADASRHRLLQELAEGMRDPLASVRAAIETMTEYPDMEEAVAAQFKRIILEQTVVLSQRLEQALDTYASVYRSQWPLDEMAGEDLLAMLHVRLDDVLDVPVESVLVGDEGGDRELMRVRADTHALSEAIVFLGQRIVNAAQCDHITLRIQRVRRFIALDLAWEGGATVSRERLRKWETETLNLGDTIISMTLREIIDRHDAEVWTQEGEDGQLPRIRLMLPVQ